MKHASLLTTALITASLSPTASAQLMRHDVPDQSYQDFATSSQFDSVVGIRFTDYGGNVRNGTGVYLGGGWILTAGHVLRNNINEPLYSDFSLVVGGNNVLSDPGYSIDSSGFVFHPDFQDEIIPGDLALFRDPFYDTLGLTAANISPDYTPTVGDRMEFATYGLPGVADQQFFDPDGFLRAGENLVDTSIVNGNFFEMEFEPPFLGQLPLEMGFTAGASGAPIFFDGELVGLGNYASILPSYAHLSGSELLSTHYDWIQSVIVPAPGAASLLGIGLLFGARRRRA